MLGAGVFAYNHHQKSEEEVSHQTTPSIITVLNGDYVQKKAHAWGLQSWLKDAQQRTQAFHQYGPQGPVTWVLVQGKNLPPNPFPGGEEHGQPLFISRAFYEGSIRKSLPELIRIVQLLIDAQRSVRRLVLLILVLRSVMDTRKLV